MKHWATDVLGMVFSFLDAHSRDWGAIALVNRDWRRAVFLFRSGVSSRRIVDVDLETISAYVLNLRRLRELNLHSSNGTLISDELLKVLGSSCKRLEHLQIVTGSSMSCCWPSLPPPSPGTPNVSSIAVDQVWQGCPSLRCFSLIRAPLVSDLSLITIAERWTQLQQFMVWDTPRVGDQGLVSLASHCPSVQVVSLTQCSTASDEFLQVLARKCPDLKTLRLSGDALTTTVLESEILKNRMLLLETLEMDSPPMTAMELCYMEHALRALLENCIRLSCLRLSKCNDLLSAQGLMALAHGCTGLKQVSLQRI